MRLALLLLVDIETPSKALFLVLSNAFKTYDRFICTEAKRNENLHFNEQTSALSLNTHLRDIIFHHERDELQRRRHHRYELYAFFFRSYACTTIVVNFV